MLASAATTTGLFVLAGVVVGGLVTASVNYFLESRRERASARVAMRLLESELAKAAALADWRLGQGAWSPWNFESAHSSWAEYRAEIASPGAGLSPDEWYTVANGFLAIELIESRFTNKPIAAKLDADEQKALDGASSAANEGANTLRRRQGLKEFARF